MNFYVVAEYAALTVLVFFLLALLMLGASLVFRGLRGLFSPSMHVVDIPPPRDPAALRILDLEHQLETERLRVAYLRGQFPGVKADGVREGRQQVLDIVKLEVPDPYAVDLVVQKAGQL